MVATPVIRPLCKVPMCNTNSPLKCGHPTNQDTLTGPKGGLISGSLLWLSNGSGYISYSLTESDVHCIVEPPNVGTSRQVTW